MACCSLPTMRVTVGNAKGGTAKTTTAVFLALGLGRTGRTLLVDGDPQQSALDWTTNAADWPAHVVVIPWATRDLGRRVREVADDYRHVVIDTGPEQDAILRQALLATDRLIVPVAPSPIELRRLPATFDLAAEIDAIDPVFTSILLCKVRAGTRSADAARAWLDERDLPVMDAQTHLWEQYTLAWGSAPADLAEYDAILAELEAEEQVTADD